MTIKSAKEKKSELAEIYQVAHMYYDLNMVQSEIAEKLYLSRPKVSRMLNQAKELGIVQIKVNPIIDRVPLLERRVRKVFGLKEAIIIATDPNQMEKMEDMLQAAAGQYVTSLLKKGGVLGLTNSTTINGVLDNINFPEECTTEIVQLIGSVSNSFSMQDTALILSRLSDSMANIKVHALAVPLYVNDLYLKEIMMQEPSVTEVFQKMTQCTIAITDISTLENDMDYHISWKGQMGFHHYQELLDHKGVGSICAQYFDAAGVKVSSEWNAKIIAMNLNDFCKIPTRAAIAQGLDKLSPIYGALYGRLINVLITDSNTASDLIEMALKKKVS